MPRKRKPPEPPVEPPSNVTSITTARRRVRKPRAPKEPQREKWQPLVGTPNNLTHRHVDKFVEHLSNAMGWQQAAHLAGVSPNAASNWRQTIKDFVDDLENCGLPEIVWEFVGRGENAVIECESALVLSILAQCSRDWRAAIAVLERTVPDRWEKKPQDLSLRVTGEVVYGMSERQLKRMALWMEASQHGIRNAKGDVIVTPERLLREHKLPAPIKAMLEAQAIAKEGAIDVESWERSRLDDTDK